MNFSSFVILAESASAVSIKEAFMIYRMDQWLAKLGIDQIY